MRRSCLVLFIASLSSSALAATPQTFLTLDSQPGDYVGQGVLQTFTPADGTFILQPSPGSGAVQLSFSTSDYSSFWLLQFGPVTGQKLTRGEYEGAQQFPVQSPTKPGISISGDGRGCSSYGRFLVSDVAFNTDGSIARLAIDFEQRCEEDTAALYGSVRYNSTVPAIPRVGVGRATALKGNAGTSDATVILSLCLPSTQLITVQYATLDGSGVAGTDYLSTTGTVQFQPGTTSQPITIPIVGDRLVRGNKTFKVKLISSNGAPIGAATAPIKIFDPNVAMTALFMSSQTGDYIGKGQLYLFTIGDGSFTTQHYSNAVIITLRAADSWAAYFDGPTSANLAKGEYPNAQRAGFQPAGTPGLDVFGAARGCNTLSGSFVVNKVSYRADGSVSVFSADFEQHCEEATPALFGSVRINSRLQQFSVSDAVVNSSGSPTAVFTVTLNPASTQLASVVFATADGTALAGTDYEAASQTVTFLPGEVAHTVSVPLLSQPTGQKKFFGQLSAPNGFQIWIDQGSASF